MSNPFHKTTQNNPLGHKLVREGLIMKNCMITFRSVTPAQQAEAYLQRMGVECVVQRTPKRMEEKGCGYSVRLDCKDAMAAVTLLRQNNIGFKRVYRMTENGTSEELHL